MKNILIIVGIIIVGGLAYYMFMMNKPASTMPYETQTQTTPESTTGSEQTPMMEQSIVLSTQNNSGEAGVVTLSEVNGQVKVVVNMTGAPATAQPAHIHTGACPNPGAVKYPLTDVVNGMSETMVPMTMEALKAQMPLAVNIHKSAAESKVYVACGDIVL